MGPCYLEPRITVRAPLRRGITSFRQGGMRLIDHPSSQHSMMPGATSTVWDSQRRCEAHTPFITNIHTVGFAFENL